MVEFRHKLTGTRMLVSEDRVKEYEEAGHKPVSSSLSEEKKPAPKKTTARKKTTKKGE